MVWDVITDGRTGAPALAKFRDQARAMITAISRVITRPFLRDPSPGLITEVCPGHE